MGNFAKKGAKEKPANLWTPPVASVATPDDFMPH
jgi:hypothetical protein